MTLAIVLGVGWLLVVGGVLSIFRIAARGDEVLPPAGWHAGGAMDDGRPAAGGPPALGRFGRRLYAVNGP
jgi:hypothetical protein